MLQGFKGFRGGLDVTANETGTESYSARHGQYAFMFHVVTMLPFSRTDSEQVIILPTIKFAGSEEL